MYDIWLFRQQSQFKANLSQLKPIQSQFVERKKSMQGKYSQRLMNKTGIWAKKANQKTNPIKANKIAFKIYPFGIDCPIVYMIFGTRL